MSEQRDAETWDGAKVADAMVVRGDLTIGDLMQEEIATFSPEAQAVLREQAAAKLAAAPKRRGMSAASAAMLLGAVALGGGSAGPVRESRAEREAHKASRPGGDERIAKAEAKRQRKAARRLTPATASVGRCMDCNRTIAECDKALCSRTHNQGEARGSRE